MHFAKLQISLLIIILFINFIYIKTTLSKKIPCNKYYDCLMLLAPVSIFFDGLTAITVNLCDNNLLNICLHVVFFITTDLYIFILYLYMIDKTIGLPKSKLLMACLMAPIVISITLIFVFIKDLNFIHGVYTNYSMGLSVIVCYITLIVHFGIIIFLVLYKFKVVERRKRSLLLIALIFSVIVLAIQMIYKESLISSLFTTLTLVGIYISFEDPSFRRLEIYNSEMVTSFSTLVEGRDESTGGHIKRTKKYVEILVRKMSLKKDYSKLLTIDYINHVIDASPMHDIGKISTPDNILQKPGKLTNEEYEIIKLHTINGGKLIKETFSDIDDEEFIKIAYEEAMYHHEKWNGKGYPMGLKGEEIPLSARIMAIADVFDAVSAKRCYRDKLPIDECFKIIENGSGSDFDPRLVELFLEAKEEILITYNSYK